MAKHIVKCPICGKSFDRDIVPCHQDGRRYLHIECWARQEASKTQDDKDKEALEEYIKELFKLGTIPQKIQKQIESFHKEYHYTYTGIKKSLVYHFEVKKGDIKQANGGIGIVPYVYEQARIYYYQIWQAQQKNTEKVIDDYIPKVINIKIKNPQKQPKKRKLFSFLDEEEIDGK